VVEDAGGTGGVEMIERLTGANHKELGFHTYIGVKSPYSAALTLGELLLDNTNPKYRPREILNDVFNRLAAYEDSGLSPEEVQAQQQEIELLKIARDNWKKTAEIWDKALKQARDALDDSLQYIDEACIHEAIAEINKVIGGKEDA
jgi:hypothetical protein